MDPRLWIYLDNLRCNYLPQSNLTDEWLEWARAEARSKVFVDNSNGGERLTCEGRIALLITLGKS